MCSKLTSAKTALCNLVPNYRNECTSEGISGPELHQREAHEPERGVCFPDKTGSRCNYQKQPVDSTKRFQITAEKKKKKKNLAERPGTARPLMSRSCDSQDAAVLCLSLRGGSVRDTVVETERSGSNRTANEMGVGGGEGG